MKSESEETSQHLTRGKVEKFNKYGMLMTSHKNFQSVSGTSLTFVCHSYLFSDAQKQKAMAAVSYTR